ncbi:amidohydrolase [Burkholderiales bacterium GJ-E10]|nr:amidohydrolase [Burkholderiales bacterium GJ-E10]
MGVMRLPDDIASAVSPLQAIRRDIHAHPELAFAEQRTSDLVADLLAQWGVEVHRGIGGTGVVGVVRGSRPGRMIGLRADMDALPIQEANRFLHRSVFPGRMHACGHDGHTAMLLGAAQSLAQDRSFAGTVVAIFQPAEEAGGGAKRMVDDGLFTRFPCDAVFAIHNWPGLPVGTFAIADGPAMASTSEFEIRIEGRGAHGAMPELGVDPVFVAVQIAQGLQGLITRVKRPIDPAVLSITMIHAGDATNVIPDIATICGTLRTFDDAVTDRIEAGMHRIAEATAQAHEARARVRFDRNYPPTVNHPGEARFAARVAEELVGADRVLFGVEPSMGAEDFAFLLRERPGAYLLLGNGDGDHRAPEHGIGPCTLHNASYDFNDDLLPIGAAYWVRLAQAFLES